MLFFLIVTGYSQIEITMQDAEKWEGGNYIEIEPPYYYHRDSLLDINITIGENVVWDFSGITDTMIDTMEYITNFNSTIRSLTEFELAEYPNATHIEVFTKNYGDSTAFIYGLADNEYTLIGEIYHNIFYKYQTYDTILYFPLQFGDIKVKYNFKYQEGDEEFILDELIRHFNSYGKFIMPGGEQVNVIGFREKVIYTDEEETDVLYFYKFYSKEYGVVGEIYIQNVTDTTLFTAGNTYNMKETAGLSSDSSISIRLMKSKNPSGLLNRPFNQKNIKWANNNLNNNELFDNRFYNILGREIKEPLSGGTQAGVFFKCLGNGRTVKTVFLK